MLCARIFLVEMTAGFSVWCALRSMMRFPPSTQSGPSAGYVSMRLKRLNWSVSSFMCGLSFSASLKMRFPSLLRGSRFVSIRVALSVFFSSSPWM